MHKIAYGAARRAIDLPGSHSVGNSAGHSAHCSVSRLVSYSASHSVCHGCVMYHFPGSWKGGFLGDPLRQEFGRWNLICVAKMVCVLCGVCAVLVFLPDLLCIYYFECVLEVIC